MFRKKPTCAIFDIDDTVGQFTAEFWKFVRARHPETPTNISQFWLFVDSKLDKIAELQAFEKDGGLSRIGVNEIIREKMEEERTKGRRIVFLTARGWMNTPYTVTWSWIRHNDLDVDAVFVTDLDQCKSNLIPIIQSKYGKVASYYEDNHDHACNCIPGVERVYYVRHPWSERMTDDRLRKNEIDIPFVMENSNDIEPGIDCPTERFVAQQALDAECKELLEERRQNLS